LVSPVARRILERALTHAAARDSSELTALDLLRGLVMHDESGAARTLARMGIDPARLRSEVSSAQDLKALPRV
ncbi:MAG: Clp protease N-terminal domain-containing protein, partial [Solirubrobacteraceae bacterium]